MVLVLHSEPAVPRNPLPLLSVAQEVPQGPTVPVGTALVKEPEVP